MENDRDRGPNRARVPSRRCECPRAVEEERGGRAVATARQMGKAEHPNDVEHDVEPESRRDPSPRGSDGARNRRSGMASGGCRGGGTAERGCAKERKGREKRRERWTKKKKEQKGNGEESARWTGGRREEVERYIETRGERFGGNRRGVSGGRRGWQRHRMKMGKRTVMMCAKGMWPELREKERGERGGRKGGGVRRAPLPDVKAGNERTETGGRAGRRERMWRKGEERVGGAVGVRVERGSRGGKGSSGNGNRGCEAGGGEAEGNGGAPRAASRRRGPSEPVRDRSGPSAPPGSLRFVPFRHRSLASTSPPPPFAPAPTARGPTCPTRWPRWAGRSS